MSFDNLEVKVKEVVAEQLSMSSEELTMETNLSDIADSLDMVELMMSLEEEFGFEIPDEEAEQLSTIQKTVEWIANKAA